MRRAALALSAAAVLVLGVSPWRVPLLADPRTPTTTVVSVSSNPTPLYAPFTATATVTAVPPGPGGTFSLTGGLAVTAGQTLELGTLGGSHVFTTRTSLLNHGVVSWPTSSGPIVMTGGSTGAGSTTLTISSAIGYSNSGAVNGINLIH